MWSISTFRNRGIHEKRSLWKSGRKIRGKSYWLWCPKGHFLSECSSVSNNADRWNKMWLKKKTISLDLVIWRLYQSSQAVIKTYQTVRTKQSYSWRLDVLNEGASWVNFSGGLSLASYIVPSHSVFTWPFLCACTILVSLPFIIRTPVIGLGSHNCYWSKVHVPHAKMAKTQSMRVWRKERFIDWEATNQEDETSNSQAYLKKVQSVGLFYVKRRGNGKGKGDWQLLISVCQQGSKEDCASWCESVHEVPANLW